MADFSLPEYASYVQLCRELRLERRLQPGDLYWVFGDALIKDQLRVFVPVRTGPPVLLPRGDDAHGTVWLPALADWLEMLEAAGAYHIAITPFDDGYAVTDLGGNGWTYQQYGPDGPAFPAREEAAARLWMAVTQTPVGPAPPSVTR